MRIVRNLGINIKHAIEKQKRSMQHAPKENLSYIKNAKKDFAVYAKIEKEARG